MTIPTNPGPLQQTAWGSVVPATGIYPVGMDVTPWNDGSEAADMRQYAGVEIQILTITGTVTFTRSLNNTAYAAIQARDIANSYASVNPTAAGFFTLPGGGYLKWGGTATMLVRGLN